MAEAKKKRVIKKSETVREKATKKEISKQPRRLHKATSAAKRPVSAARKLGAKEYHPIKMRDNRLGRFMTANRKLTPKFFREAWAELRQVTWPTNKETFKLALAVFIFAIVLGITVGILDYGLEKLFREILID